MTDRAQGIKKSRFAGNANPLSADKFDFVSQGVNYSITLTELQAIMGLMGSIVQSGDPLGVPVLDPQGAVNNIRNLEVSTGITAAVSPQNGLELKTALLPSVGGVQTLINETIAPQFRSIVAGSGIQVAAAGNNIQISSVAGAPVTTKTVIVDTINDFPGAIGGAIPLADNTEYFLINDITTSNRFVMGTNTAMVAGDQTTITLTYTGTDAMFTASGESSVFDIGLSAAAGTLLDVSNGRFTIARVLVDACVNIATVNAAARFIIDSATFASVTGSGITFTGANTAFNSNLVEYNLTAGILFDIGTATFDVFTLSSNVFELDGVTTLLSGNVASANVNAGRVATLMNNRIGGDGPITPLVGVTADDDRWQFSLNDLIKDTTRRALLSMIGNGIATGIVTVNTPVRIAGIRIIGAESGYSGDALGAVTYNSPKPIDARITAHISAIKTGGSSQNYSFYIAKNGAIIPQSKISAFLDNVDIFSSTLVWTEGLVQTDVLELFVENNGNTNDVTIVDSQLRID